MAQSILRLAVLFSLVGAGQAHAEGASLDTLGVASAPLLSPGSPATWHGSDGNDLEIFLSDGGVTTQLTFNDVDDSFPHRSGAMVAWQGWDGNDWEIFQFDGTIMTQLTDNGFDDITAHISGAIVEWQGWDGNDWEIFQWFDGNIAQLTDNDVDDRILYPIEMGGPPQGSTGSAADVIIPEPSTLTLAAFGLLSLLVHGHRRRRA